MKSKIQKFREYLDYVERHYDNVQKAWQEIQDKCDKKHFRFMYDDFVFFCIDGSIKKHDLSKLSAEEFTQYRQFFFPVDGEVKDKTAFESAWKHHWETNAHHWENWTRLHDNNYYAKEVALIENICDWMAMGYEFGDTAKEYYENNKDKINLPEWAISLMYEVFDCVYPNLKK